MGDWTRKTEDVKHVLQDDSKAEQEDNEAHCKLECKDFTISGVRSLTSESLPVTEESFAGNDIGSIEMDYVKVKMEDPNDQTSGDLEYILDDQLSCIPTPVLHEEPERYYGSSRDRPLSITAPISAAEIQRRYRAHREADPERRQKYQQGERQRWRRDVEQRMKKIVSDLSELEKIQQHNKWRKQCMKRKVMADARKDSLDTPIILSNIQGSNQDLQDRSVSITAPISAAERQRRYRARRDADPERREKYLQGERQRWRRDVEQGKKKKISDLSELGKMEQRNKWREQNLKRKVISDARKHSLDTPIILSNIQSSNPDLQGQKRTANKLVINNHNMPNAHELYESLKETSTAVKLFYVARGSVRQAMERMPGWIPQVSSTVKTHQLDTFTPEEIFYQQMGCICSTPKQLRCQCFATQHFQQDHKMGRQ